MQLLLVALVRGPLLVDVLGACALVRHELLHVEHIGLQGLVPHNVVALVGGRNNLDVLVDLGVVELALVPWDHFLGDDAVHIPEGDLVNHCHEMGFVELDDLHGLGDDEEKLKEDLHPKKFPKSVGLSGAVLMVLMF